MQKKKYIWRVAPLLAGLGIFALSASLSYILATEERDYVKTHIELKAENVRTEMEEHIEFQALALERMARRWEADGKLRQERWRSDAKLYVKQSPLYQAIEWVDPSFHVRWIAPLEGNEKALGLNLLSEERRRVALERARDTREITATHAIDLAQGGKGFRIYVPIFQNGEFGGFTSGVFRIDKLLEHILKEKFAEGISLTIFDNNEEIYNKGDAGLGDLWDDTETNVTFNNITWHLKTRPLPEYLADKKSYASEAILVAGVLLAFLLAWTIHVSQKARERAREIDKYNLALEEEIRERIRMEEEQRGARNLLDAINKAQSQYIAHTDSHTLFDGLLTHLLGLSQSKYGFIGKILQTPEGESYLKIHAITDIAWNEETRELYEKLKNEGMEFHNLKTLFGAVITSEEPVIANNPSTDPRRGGLPKGHPPLDSFLGIPLKVGGQTIGMAGIANRPGGYNENLLQYIQPLINTCAQIIEAYWNEQKYKRAKEDLHKAHDQLERRVEERTEQLIKANEILQKTLDAREEMEEKIRSLSKFPAENPNPVMRATNMGALLYANEVCFNIFGKDFLKIGEPLPDLFLKPVVKSFAANATECTEIEFNNRVFLFTIRPVPELNYVNFYGTDITDLKRAKEKLQRTHTFLQLDRAIAEAAGEAQTFEEIVKICLDKVCEFTGWPIGHVYLCQNDPEKIAVPAPIWHFDDPERFKSFKKISETTRFLPGEGLPGQVLASGKPLWIKNVTQDLKFPRAKAIKHIGIMAAFGFPVLKGKEVIAVLEFFSEEILEPDEALLAALAHIGVQLGRVIERTQAEEKEQQINQKLSQSNKELSQSNVSLTKALEELRMTQSILVRSEKLATVGLLSAGVAHEVLNPLNIVSTIVQLEQLNSDLPKETREHLDEIKVQVKRATKILNNIRMFSHKKTTEITPVKINEFLDNTTALVEHDFNLDNIIISKDYGDNLPVIHTDEDLLATVILNLLNNARDAIHEQEEKLITIKTRTLASGIEITISDTGPGIPPDNIGKIFDPFFTTKDPGKGTGLGLWMAYSSLAMHGGDIKAESEEGKGARFIISLPLESTAPKKKKDPLESMVAGKKCS